MIKQKNKPHPIWKRTKNISTIIIIISALSACNTINNSNDPSLYPTFIGKNKIRGSKNFKYSKIDVNTKIIDSKGDWSELYNLNDISNFILGSKSETLHRLRGVIKKGKIFKCFTNLKHF